MERYGQKILSNGFLYEHRSLMLIPNLAFEEWMEIFGSARLTVALLYRSLTAGKSWKPMEKVTGCGRPGNHLSGNLLRGRT
jgi:hypothetical protein